MDNKLPTADSVLVNDKIYYSETYIKLQMRLEYQRGYSDCSQSNTVIHRAEIIECINCTNIK
jgi:hypothetical protein